MSMQIRHGLQRKKTTKNRFTQSESVLVRWSNALRRLLAPLLLLAMGSLVGIYGFPYFKDRINQPVSRVIVEGDLRYLDRREVMKAVPVYQEDRWLDVSLEGLQLAVESMPWIYAAQVSRQWPSTLHIRLQEQTPIARWNEGYVLNQYGQFFDRDSKVVKHLPLLEGMSGSEQNVMGRYLEFSRLLSPLRLRLIKLQLDERLSWTATLDNGMVLQVGNSQAMERMKRFVFLYRNQLAETEREVSVVDLRYVSGAAVSWGAPLDKSS